MEQDNKHLQLTDNEALLKGFQAWQNESTIRHQEKVKVIIRAPEWANIGAKYGDMHPDPLPDDAPLRHLMERLDHLRHALDAESPFRIDIVDGTGSTHFPCKYETVGDLRASYANPGKKVTEINLHGDSNESPSGLDSCSVRAECWLASRCFLPFNVG